MAALQREIMASPILSPDGLWEWNGKEWIPYKFVLDNYNHTNLFLEPPLALFDKEIKPHQSIQPNPLHNMIEPPPLPSLGKKETKMEVKEVEKSTTTPTNNVNDSGVWSNQLQTLLGIIFVVGILIFTPIVSQHQTIENGFSLPNGQRYFYDIDCPDGCEIRINVTAMAYGTLELITVEGSGYRLCNGGVYYPSLSSPIYGETHFAEFLEPGSYSIIFDNSDCGNVPAITYGGLVVFEITLCKPKFTEASIVSKLQCFVKEEIL